MNANSLRRWSRPKAILVISTVAESPAHTLRVISGLRATGARLFLVQLPAATRIMYPPDQNIPFLLAAAPRSFERQAGNHTGQAFLWAEILSEVTVLKNTPVERIPALADSLGADLVVLTTAEIGRIPLREGSSLDLFGSLSMPILICGARMLKMRPWSRLEIRKILVPVTFGPDLGLQIRFACRFARRHHSRLTVLHVFDHPAGIVHPWEHSPAGVEARLPISELRQEGIMCEMEFAVKEGYPERKILAFNDERPHDLILMGGPRRRDPLQGSGGAVTTAVLAEAQCPVLMLGSAIMTASSSVAESNSKLSMA